MTVFREKRGEILYPKDNGFDDIIGEWADLIRKGHKIGFIPLFITGCGVSKETKNLKGEKVILPDIYDIVDALKESYEKVNANIPDINNLFKEWEILKHKKKKDRSIVAKILEAFQKDTRITNYCESQQKDNPPCTHPWKEFNNQLLDKIVDAEPALFHEKLSDVYKLVDAVCLTLNFDGLLIRALLKNRKNNNERAFSLPIKSECESFFLRTLSKNNQNERNFLEIQIRGDILYVTCTAKGYCPQKGAGKERSIWASIASYISGEEDKKALTPKPSELLKCPSCGEAGVPFLSFPGSYDKEKAMQGMLETIWKYLAFRVGTVTVVGLSGEWDPLIIAFLGDLLSERAIPLMVIDRYPEAVKSENDGKKATYIIRELVKPKTHFAVALGIDADNFMEKLSANIMLSEKTGMKVSKNIWTNPPVPDKYWDDDKDIWRSEQSFELKKSINSELSDIEKKLTDIMGKEKIHKFAQLGLKSHWLGIDQGNSKAKYHTRYYHSIGVMKIASYLYKEAIKNSNMKSDDCELQFLRMAALLHDIGHLPFSHLIEDIFNELNWKPAAYKGFYSHVFQTDEKIKALFSEGSEYKRQLNDLGYTVDELINLINGRYGVGYLDAIVNSPLDADKIDYVFRDTDSTNRKISIPPIQFLKDIVDGLILTPEKYIAFSGISAKAMSELLNARSFLYRNLYLQPGILILEGIIKLIIKTFFVRIMNLEEDNIMQRIKQKRFPDLGEYKITFCIDKLQGLLDEAITSNCVTQFLEKLQGEKPHNKLPKDIDNYELKIICLMFNEIDKNKHSFNKIFLQNLQLGFGEIINTNSEDDLKRLESKIIHWRIKGAKEKIDGLLRDVKFRLPGAAVMEASRLPKVLSTADSRKEKERSDGTKIFSETILVPKENHEIWNPTHKAAIAIHDSSLKNAIEQYHNVYLYPLAGDLDNSYFKQALNLIEKLFNKNGISTEANEAGHGH